MKMNVTIDVVAHHLRIFGALDTSNNDLCELGYASTAEDLAGIVGFIELGVVYVAVLPTQSFLEAIGASELGNVGELLALNFIGDCSRQWGELRSLHPVSTFGHPDGEPLLVTGDGNAVWLKIPFGKGFILIIGTDLAGDLIRYRQGDPAQAGNLTAEALWGIAGERPNYLFEAQIPVGCDHDRPADWWALALAQTIADCLGETLKPLLPNGALGAIVITGDDDQAYLEKYQEQLDLLNGLPITYFLHPLTRHTPKTLAVMNRHHRVELGLHPDALEQPDRYAELYREQAAWFHALTGQHAGLVRNHGFLNDGYWGHLPVWLEQGVKASANLPGLNGKILNGSLLPARMVWNGQLTSHWSILTAIGDGVRYALGMDGPQSAQCIRDLAGRILDSKLPGVIVLNLHPQNVAETKEMHIVLHELVREGFVPMTLGDCIDWFAARDRGEPHVYEIPDGGIFTRIYGKLIRCAKNFVAAPPTEPIFVVAPPSEPIKEVVIKAKIQHYQAKQEKKWHSFDRHPWKHPWLVEKNLQNMRVFSQEIRSQAKFIRAKLKKSDVRFGFVCNLANNLYTLAKTLRPMGAEITIVTHPGDDYIMSQPEWEEYDGFLAEDISSFSEAKRRGYVFPKIDHILRGELTNNWVSYEEMPDFVSPENYYQWRDYYSYLPVIKTLRQFDSLFAVQAPYLAYLSGKPYITWHMGGDIWYECSRNDMLGQLQRAAFSNASIFIASNPWSYAFARRYGMRNMIYMPSPLNAQDYQPGAAEFREQWQQETGGKFFVLTTARMDDLFKGSQIALEGFLQFSKKNPHARLLVIGWGADLERYQVRINQLGLTSKVKILPPVGKKRLIRYLRSAHCLLDQFVLGYYGRTTLEAMAVGVPVIMRVEKAQYDSFSDAGCPPVFNAENVQEVSVLLAALSGDATLLSEAGEKSRSWFMKYSGNPEWPDAYIDLLTVIASGHKFDFHDSPLNAPLSPDEISYHQNELKNAPPFPNYF